MKPGRGFLLALCSLAVGGGESYASIALAPGDVVIGAQSPAAVYGIDRLSGASRGSCACTECGNVFDLTVRGTSEVYVVAPGRIVEITTASCANRVVASVPPLFRGIALDRDGELLVSVGDCDGCAKTGVFPIGGVLRVVRATGATSILWSGAPLYKPLGLDVAPDGRVYVASQGFRDSYGAVVFPNGVFRIDPGDPVASAFVAIGDDTVVPIDRTDIVSASDVAIENSTGPLYVLDTRYRGSTLQDELRLVAVDLTGAASDNQTLLTRSLEGIDQDASSGQVAGIEVAGGTLFAIDLASGAFSSREGGMISFVPGLDVGEGTHVTDAELFHEPSGLAIVPEPASLASGMAACLALLGLGRTTCRRYDSAASRGA